MQITFPIDMIFTSGPTKVGQEVKGVGDAPSGFLALFETVSEPLSPAGTSPEGSATFVSADTPVVPQREETPEMTWGGLKPPLKEQTPVAISGVAMSALEKSAGVDHPGETQAVLPVPPSINPKPQPAPDLVEVSTDVGSGAMKASISLPDTPVQPSFDTVQLEPNKQVLHPIQETTAPIASDDPELFRARPANDTEARPADETNAAIRSHPQSQDEIIAKVPEVVQGPRAMIAPRSIETEKPAPNSIWASRPANSEPANHAPDAIDAGVSRQIAPIRPDVVETHNMGISRRAVLSEPTLSANPVQPSQSVIASAEPTPTGEEKAVPRPVPDFNGGPIATAPKVPVLESFTGAPERLKPPETALPAVARVTRNMTTPVAEETGELRAPSSVRTSGSAEQKAHPTMPPASSRQSAMRRVANPASSAVSIASAAVAGSPTMSSDQSPLAASQPAIVHGDLAQRFPMTLPLPQMTRPDSPLIPQAVVRAIATDANRPALPIANSPAGTGVLQPDSAVVPPAPVKTAVTTDPSPTNRVVVEPILPQQAAQATTAIAPVQHPAVVANPAVLTSAALPELTVSRSFRSEETGELPEEMTRSSATETAARDVFRANGDVRLTRQVAAQLVDAARNMPDRPVEITLNPEELGNVKMTLRASEGTISVVLAIERGETADLMRRNLDTLTEEFRNLGYSEISFSFSGGDTHHPESDRQADAPGDTLPLATDTEPESAVPIQLTLGGGIDIRL